MEGLIHSVTECNEEEIYTTDQLAKEAEALTLVTELFERLTEREGQLTEANRLLVREKARNEVCVCVCARVFCIWLTRLQCSIVATGYSYLLR